jgi:hypothetical protein
MSTDKLYKLHVENLPSQYHGRSHFEFIEQVGGEVDGGWPPRPDMRGQVSMQSAQFVRRSVEVKHYRVKGDGMFIAMGPEVLELVDYVFDEERRQLEALRDEALGEKEEFVRSMSYKRLTFNAMPWYRRVWLAFKKQVP